MSKENEECCPKFEPEPWDGKIIEWDHKKFIKDKVFTFLHMPITFGKVMTRLSERVEKAGAKMPDWFCLSHHTSKWNMDVYLAVSKEIPGADNVQLSGKYFAKVYEGPFKDTGKWCKDFEKLIKSRKMKMDEMNHQQMNLWVSSSETQESASSSPSPPNGGAYPMETIVSEETVKVPVHEFRRGFLRMYQWYTTCPKCAKKYGKNYVVIIAQCN